MSVPGLRVPASVAGDHSDVEMALEVSGALWDKGDDEDAIRWIRRAVDAAKEAGDAARATHLSEAASELERAVAGARASGAAPRVSAVAPSVAPPAVSSAPATASVAPPAPSASLAPVTVPSVAPVPAAVPNVSPVAVSVSPMPAMTAPGASPAMSVAPAPSASPVASVAPAPSASPVAPTPSAAPVSMAPRPSIRTSLQAAAAHASTAPAQPGEARPALAIADPLALGQTGLRVSIKVSVRDPSLLVVRLLPEGQKAPAGTREGQLFVAPPDDDARGRANGSHTPS